MNHHLQHWVCSMFDIVHVYVLLVKRCSLAHRFKAMAGTTIPVWVKVKDRQSVLYDMEPSWVVSRLLHLVKKESELTVGINLLKLYRSEAEKTGQAPFLFVAPLMCHFVMVRAIVLQS